MDDIKSAREIAMEKTKELGEATEGERLKWKYTPQGKELAARYIKQGCNLVEELSKYEEKARGYIITGAEDVLIGNIGLPVNDSARRNNRKVMDGLKTLKSDKVGVENVFSKMRNIFKHYAEQGEQQRRQAYESLKAEFTAKIQQAVQQQLGSTLGLKIDVDNQPQFQAEWRKVRIQLDSQYITLLNEYKQELKTVS
jgi:hypothetical protein